MRRRLRWRGPGRGWAWSVAVRDRAFWGRAPSFRVARGVLGSAVEDLRAREGWVRLDDLVVEDFIGPAWPTDHSYAIRHGATGSDDAEVIWYVTSPWPSLTPAEVIQLMWRWVLPQVQYQPVHEANAQGPTPRDLAAEERLVREFLRKEEAWVLALRDAGAGT